MKNIGLVLEGGGLRGVYSSGILDYFLSRGLEFEYTIGVSAGAIYSASYASKQKERNIDIFLKYLDDPRYMGVQHLLKTGSYINIEFAYKKMTYELSPFDFETFYTCTKEFKVGAFNCEKGRTDYFCKKDFKSVDDLLEALIASGSLPFFCNEMNIHGKTYLDGGIASPIPIQQSILDGNSKNVVILTEDDSYIKEPLGPEPLIKFYFRKYPKVASALINRHLVYNDTLEKIKVLEKLGDVFVFRPSEKVEVDRLERNLDKVKYLYELGKKDAEKNYDSLMNWLKKNIQKN